MTHRRRILMGVAIIVTLFLFIQLTAIALVEPFGGEYEPVENPEDPTNSLLYFVVVLVATGGILLAFKYGGQALIRAVIVFAGAWLSLYVFRELFPAVVTVGGENGLALAGAAAIAYSLYAYPEWYVIDAAGAVMGAAAAGLFGISLGLLPAIVLLVVLAIYDAISVYGTEHMLDLASGVLDLKVPVVLVIPLSPGYSFLDETPPASVSDDEASDDSTAEDGDSTAEDGDATADEGDEITDSDPLEREALFIGLGDAVIPTVLVASAAYFLPQNVSQPLPQIGGLPIPVLTAMIGTFAGLGVLLWMVMKGKPHAGLPLLNGGTIAGYLLGALASGLTLAQATGL